MTLKCHLYVLNQFPFSAAMWVSTLPRLKRACLYWRTTDGGSTRARTEEWKRNMLNSGHCAWAVRVIVKQGWKSINSPIDTSWSTENNQHAKKNHIVNNNYLIISLKKILNFIMNIGRCRDLLNENVSTSFAAQRLTAFFMFTRYQPPRC